MTEEQKEVIWQAIFLLQRLESRLGREDEDYDLISNLSYSLLDIVES